MTDKKNQPPAKRDPYAKPGLPLGMVAQMRTAALHGNLASNFGVVGTPGPVAPRVQSSNCGPGQVVLPTGQCGHVVPPAPMKDCPRDSIRHLENCYPLPPMPQLGAILLASTQTSRQRGPVFYAFARRAMGTLPTGVRVTRNALVFSGGTWSPTKLDQQMLSTMSVVRGAVPAGKELKIIPSAELNAANQLELVLKAAPGGVSGPSLADDLSALHRESAAAAKPQRLPINGAMQTPRRPADAASTTSLKALFKMNKLPASLNRSIPMPKARIAPAVALGAHAVTIPNSSARATYVTRTGDTLKSVAAAHGITLHELQHLNPGVLMIFNSPLSRGIALSVPKRG